MVCTKFARISSHVCFSKADFRHCSTSLLCQRNHLAALRLHDVPAHCQPRIDPHKTPENVRKRSKQAPKYPQTSKTSKTLKFVMHGGGRLSGKATAPPGEATAPTKLFGPELRPFIFQSPMAKATLPFIALMDDLRFRHKLDAALVALQELRPTPFGHAIMAFPNTLDKYYF